MTSLSKILAVVGAHGLAAAFVPPIKLVVKAVGTLCPVDHEGLPGYWTEVEDEGAELYDPTPPA